MRLLARRRGLAQRAPLVSMGFERRKSASHFTLQSHTKGFWARWLKGNHKGEGHQSDQTEWSGTEQNLETSVCVFSYSVWMLCSELKVPFARLWILLSYSESRAKFSRSLNTEALMQWILLAFSNLINTREHQHNEFDLTSLVFVTRFKYGGKKSSENLNRTRLFRWWHDLLSNKTPKPCEQLPAITEASACEMHHVVHKKIWHCYQKSPITACWMWNSFTSAWLGKKTH